MTTALAVGLCAATAWLYWPACDNGFVNFDDEQYVTENPDVLGGLRPAAVRWAATAVFASNWHPLTWWSLQLDAELFGSGPRGFHRTNVLLHAANAALVLVALAALTGCPGRSAVVAVLFAVHPQHVESVAWVAERKDVLAAFFFLLGAALYPRYAVAPSVGRMAPVAAALALGLMA
ncbi:MAG: tetratricopeptide repeat protein, partial [Fimbriiglobus sp.]